MDFLLGEENIGEHQIQIQWKLNGKSLLITCFFTILHEKQL